MSKEIAEKFKVFKKTAPALTALVARMSRLARRPSAGQTAGNQPCERECVATDSTAGLDVEGPLQVARGSSRIPADHVNSASLVLEEPDRACTSALVETVIMSPHGQAINSGSDEHSFGTLVARR